MRSKKLKKLAETNWVFKVDNELFDPDGKSNIDKLIKRIANLEKGLEEVKKK